MGTTGTSLRERHVERTRSSLMEAALDLFAEVGFDAATVDEIARRADVGPRTFFRYFPTKESVLFAEGADRRERVLELLQRRPDGETPLESLVGAFRQLSDLPVDPARTRKVRLIVAENPVLLGHLKSVLTNQFQEDLVSILAARSDASAHGELELRVVAAGVLGCFGAALQGYLGKEGKSLRSYFDDAVGTCRSAWSELDGT